jgi:Na+/pantothenate symporter
MNKKDNTDGDERKNEYILDALGKSAPYLYMAAYMITAVVIFSIVTPPEWLAILVMLGFGVLWTNLFWIKIVYSEYKRPDKNKDDSSEGK